MPGRTRIYLILAQSNDDISCTFASMSHHKRDKVYDKLITTKDAINERIYYYKDSIKLGVEPQLDALAYKTDKEEI